MTDLISLAERCEQAKGPDRDIDCWIENTLGLAKFERDPRVGFGDADYNRIEPKPFTASLDAAMSLVPKGLRWCVDTCGGDKVYSFVEDIYDFSAETDCHKANALSPALALCAAALRARAYNGGGDA